MRIEGSQCIEPAARPIHTKGDGTAVGAAAGTGMTGNAAGGVVGGQAPFMKQIISQQKLVDINVLQGNSRDRSRYCIRQRVPGIGANSRCVTHGVLKLAPGRVGGICGRCIAGQHAGQQSQNKPDG